MPKKYLDSDKGKWLESYESGKSEKQIAREKRCDLRTVKRGIEETRRKQEVKVARADLLKEAIRKHQDALIQELDYILSSLKIPDISDGISWEDSGDNILLGSKMSEDIDVGKEGPMRKLLREHLKNDRLWKELVVWRKASAMYLNAKIALQQKIVALIQMKTGIKMVGIRQSNPQPIKPFIYTYTTGGLFFKELLLEAQGVPHSCNLKVEIVTNTASGDVRRGGLILAEVPGNEEEVKKELLNSFDDLRTLSEVVSVVETNKNLQEKTDKARQIIEYIKLLGLIPGQCEICRRLGM